MDIEDIIWPIIRMMNGDGSMRESDYGNIIDSLRGQRDEITQLRAELEQERELADRLAGLLSRAPTKAVYMQLCIDALTAHATRRNK